MSREKNEDIVLHLARIGSELREIKEVLQEIARILRYTT